MPDNGSLAWFSPSRETLHVSSARGLSWGWLFGPIALVLYGSLIPFNFDLTAFHGSTPFGLSGLRLLATNPDDVLTNLLIYVPIGVACVLCGRPGRWGRLASVPLAIVVGVAVSLLAETLQTGLAVRAASWTDVFLNGAGAAIGAVGCVALYDLAFLALGRLRSRGIDRLFTTCTLFLTVGVIIYNLAPFDLVTSSSGLQASFLRARWDLTTPRVGAIGVLPYAAMISELSGAFWFMVLGYVSAFSGRETGQNPARALAHAIRNCVLLIVLIEFMQLFTVSHGFDLASIVIRILGAVLGARTAISVVDAKIGSRWRLSPGLAVPTLLLVVVGVLQIVAVLVSAADEPIMLGAAFDPTRVRWIPFEALWHEPIAAAACAVMSTLATYGTLAVTLAILLRRAGVSHGGWITGVAVVLLAVAVEGMQVDSVARTTDATMPILAAVAAVAVARTFTKLPTGVEYKT